MFKEKKEKTKAPEPKTSLDTVVGPGAEVVGDITVKAGMRIDGAVKGNISCQGEVVLGKSGSVEGEVKATRAVIAGRLAGKLSVEGTAELGSTAHLDGDIACSKLIIEEGAWFQGHCQMNSTAGPGEPLTPPKAKP